MSETPMMKQYLRIKSNHQEEILFFRMGDFYEMFLDDAELASKALGIALTARNKQSDNVPMAGIPVKAVDSYLPRLLQKGFKVAICEQIQDPSEAEGLVDREVVRIITPGTLTEPEVLNEKRNNFLLSIRPGKKAIGLAWVDISTSQFFVHEISSSFLADEMARINPAEALLPEGEKEKLSEGQNGFCTLLDSYNISVPCRPVWFFENEHGRRFLLEHFRINTLDSFGCEELDDALGAAGALLKYLQETQKCAIHNIDRLERHNAGEVMFLDRATRHCLEIQKTMREGNRQGTLIAVLDRTCTPMGARLLSSWLSSPLIVPDKIRERQEGVQHLLAESENLGDLRLSLSRVQDIERLCSKIAYQRANARDMLSLKNSLQAVPEIKRKIPGNRSPLLRTVERDMVALEALGDLLEKAIHPDPKPGLKEGGIIRDGYHAGLDELRQLQLSGDDWLQKFEAGEIQRTGIPSLKAGFNKVFGYYIEVTHTHQHRIPADYIRKQTLKNAERYITLELKEYEGKVLSASDRSKNLEYELFVSVRDQVGSALPSIRKVASAIALLDVLASMAKVALENRYVCPTVDTSADLEIVAGRHPVLEARGTSFVPNDLRMGPGKEIAIITGPNMAGKSTYIRQAALIVLMAQVGSFVPAEKARIGIVDRIFTRIGASDEIARGQSTFMVEMVETANILNNATGKSFIALDEIGRGTSTFDGISLAWAIIEYLQTHTKSRTLFATHYHEMTDMAEVYPNICNYNVAIKEWGEEIAFLYRIVEGSADKSYGIHVARLAGIPKEVIKRSRTILSNLEKHAVDFQSYTRSCCRGSGPKPVSENLFSIVGEHVIDALAHLDLDNLTPLEALETLKELQNEARKI